MNQTPESDLAKSADEPGKSKDLHPKKSVQGFSRAHTLAVEIAVAVIAPTLAGWWLDTKTGQEPWFMIAGLVLGGAAAFRSAQKTYHELQRDNKGDGKNAETEQPDDASGSEQPK